MADQPDTEGSAGGQPATSGVLHAERFGDGSAVAAPVVLLHGFGASAEAWRPLAGRLSAVRPVLAYDLPGHARSRGASGLGGAGAMAKAVGADLKARGITRFHLAGHSMGGAVAALIAMRAGDSACSLTLLAPGGFGPQINHRLLARYQNAADAETMRVALEGMFGWSSPVPQALIDHLVRLRNEPGAIETLDIVRLAMFVGDGPPGVQGTLPAEALRALAMPVKLIWGLQDAVLPARQADAAPWRFAVHRFAEAGHMLIDERPDAVADLIQQNLRAGDGDLTSRSAFR